MKRYVLIVLLPVIFSTVSVTATNKDFKSRAQEIIDYTADIYQPPSLSIGDPEKYYYPVTMARFAKYGYHDMKGNEYLSLLGTRGAFHFASVGLVRLIYQYPEAPAVKKGLKSILSHQLDGNLWVSEGTENHLNMERTSGFLIAQAAMEVLPERKDEILEKYHLTRDWILRWSERLLRYGEGEWNSSIYQTYSIISWLNVADFAKDTLIRDAARKVVEFYVAEMAFNYSWGTTGGAEMRGAGTLDVNRNATNYLCWLWFGSDRFGKLDMHGSQVIQSMHAVLSSYHPDADLVRTARKENPGKGWYACSRPSYLYEDTCYVKQSLYIDPGFTLGSFVSAYGGYTGASSQIVPWRLVIRQDRALPLEIGGNGSYYEEWSGKSRAPYTQYVQYRNVLIQFTKVPCNVQAVTKDIYEKIGEWRKLWKRDWLKRFPGSNKPDVITTTPLEKINFNNESFINLPKISHHFDDNLLVADAGDIFIVVRFLTSGYEFSPDNKTYENRMFFADHAPCGLLSGYYLEVVSKKDCTDMRELQRIFSGKEFLVKEDTLICSSFSGDHIRAAYRSSGSFTEPLFDWGYGAEKPQSFITAPPFRQPDWMQGENYGKIPHLYVNGIFMNYATICYPDYRSFPEEDGSSYSTE